MQTRDKNKDFYELFRNSLIAIGLAIGMIPLMNGDTSAAFVSMAIAPIVILIYFLPTLTAYKNNKANSFAILTLNLTLGWTIVFWIVALVWSRSVDVVDQLLQVKQATYDSEQKTCPFCAELIRKEAIKCKHCGSSLS